MKDGSKAVLLGLTAVLIWSTVATAFKITLRSMDPITMVFISSIVSLLSISLISVIFGKWGDIWHTSKREIASSMVLGIMNPFIYYIVLFGSYDLLKAQIAQSINYSWPVVLTVLSIFFLGQKARSRSILGILAGFLGILIISSEGFSFSSGDADPFGIVLAIGSAVIWATFWTLNLRKVGSAESKLFFNFLGGSIVVSFILLIRGAEIPNISGWTAAVYVGMFEMGITFLIWLKALSLSKETARISMLIYLSPFISLFIINAVLGESILLSTIIGLLLIVAGLIIQGRRSKDASAK